LQNVLVKGQALFSVKVNQEPFFALTTVVDRSTVNIGMTPLGEGTHKAYNIQ